MKWCTKQDFDYFFRYLDQKKALGYLAKKQKKSVSLYLAYAAPHAALQAPYEEIAKYNFEEEPFDGESDFNYVPSFKPRAMNN